MGPRRKNNEKSGSGGGWKKDGGGGKDRNDLSGKKKSTLRAQRGVKKTEKKESGIKRASVPRAPMVAVQQPEPEPEPPRRMFYSCFPSIELKAN